MVYHGPFVHAGLLRYHMFILKVNPERCKACGLCMHFCPVGGLEYAEEFNAAGYHPARQTDPEKCTGCRQCIVMCPDVAIEMFKTAGKGKAKA
jgi:2-oxoglutarate ferredoxin oxidoreductase subunit delta